MSYKKKLSNILNINTKTPGLSIIFLKDGRLCSCSPYTSAKIYNKRTYNIDLILKEIYAKKQIRLSNGYILFICGEGIKIVELIEKNKYNTIQTVVPADNYFFNDIIEINDNRFMTNGFYSFINKIRIWELDEAFDKYLCVGLKKNLHLISNIIYILDKNEISSVCKDKNHNMIKFWKIDEENNLKEISEIKLNKLSDCEIYIYKSNKYLKIIINNLIYFVNYNKYEIIYIYKINNNDYNYTREIELANGNYLVSNLTKDAMHEYKFSLIEYKYENKNIETINIFPNIFGEIILEYKFWGQCERGIKVIELKNKFLLIYNNDGYLKFYKSD